MKNVREKLAVIGMGAISLFAQVANAQTNIKLCDPLGPNCAPGNETFSTIATAVAGFLFWDIATPLATIMVLVAAFQLMTAGGDPEKVTKGRHTLLYATIGFGIAVVAGGITDLIKSLIGK